MSQLVKHSKVAYPMDVKEEERITLDTREIMDPGIARNMCNLEDSDDNYHMRIRVVCPFI